MIFCLLLIGFSAKGQQAKNELRVMSFNIRYYNNKVDQEYGWDLRKPALPAMLEDVRPAVVGLQECSKLQKDYILEECPIGYESIEFAVKRGELGKAKHAYIDPIFYDPKRVKLVEWGAFWLSDTPDEYSQSWGSKEPRAAIWARFKVVGKCREFIFVNTHLDHVSPEARQKGMDVILDRLAEINPKGKPMVLVGDLNCIMAKEHSLDRIAQDWSNAHDVAAVSDDTKTFNGFGKSWTGTIDYIWAKGYRKCSSFKVVSKAYCGFDYISDHYPIYSDIRF